MPVTGSFNTNLAGISPYLVDVDLTGPGFRILSNLRTGGDPFRMAQCPAASNANGANPVTCQFVFDQSNTVSLRVGTVEYAGSTYSFNDPTSFLTLSLAFTGGTEAVTVTPSSSFGLWQYSAASSVRPISMTGTATFVYQGNTIFSDLALSGSGTGRSDFSDIDAPGTNARYNGRYDLVADAVPEPGSLVTAGIGLLALVGLAVRRRGAAHR